MKADKSAILHLEDEDIRILKKIAWLANMFLKIHKVGAIKAEGFSTSAPDLEQEILRVNIKENLEKLNNLIKEIHQL